MASQIEEVGLRLRADGVVETAGGMRVASDAVRKLGDEASRASKPLAELGVSAGQTRAAMRQLPAQITDVWTSLASGQSAFTVAIQQGGQIKDSFGGVVPAARALVSVINPMAISYGALGLAIAGVGIAYAKGSAEQDAFAESIIMNGNAVGLTIAQMVGMAQAIDGVVGTQAGASEALAKIAGSAQVAGRDLQKLGELAVRWEQVTGQSVDATVKQFAELGRSPVQASIKLNETFNFLTESIYKQIRALVEQGKTAEAASVAQNALADAVKPRLIQMEERLGYLQRAWKSAGTAATEAWDRMLNVGRQETIDDRIAAARARVDNARRRGDEPGGYNAATGRRTLSGNAQVMQEELTLSMLLREKYDQEAGAAAKAAAAAKDRAAIVAAEAAKNKTGAAGDQALAERIALFKRIYGGTGEGELSADNLRRDFRQSEIRAEPAMEQAMVKMAAEAEATRAKALAAVAKATEQEALALERQVATLEASTAEIGLNDAALLQRQQALADQQIAEAAAQLSVIEGAAGYEGQTDALYRQIAALERLKAAQRDAAARKDAETARKTAADAYADEQAQNKRRADGIADSIEQGLVNGFRNGGSIADIFLRELKAQFARTVLRPLIDPIATGLAGGGGGLGGLFTGLLGLMGGGGVPIAPEFQTGLPMPGFDRPGEGWHGGGVLGHDSPAFTRGLPAATWRHAPRFHGGIGPDEVPAVLQRKEGVFTPGQMKALAPVDALAKAGGAGPRITYAPNFNIDSRTDRAEILAAVQLLARQSQAELLDMMERRMV